MEIIKRIDPSFFVDYVVEFSHFPTCNTIAVSAFNVVIDNIIKLNDNIISEIISYKSQHEIFRKILDELKKEEDIEISISDKNLMNFLIKFFERYVEERRFGGNAYYGYTILRHIFDETYLYTRGRYFKEISRIPKELLRNNIVFEYTKGLKIEEKTLSEDSRLIISDRSIHVDTWINKENFSKESSKKAEFYFLAGYHHIKNENDLIRSKNALMSLDGFKHVELSEFTNTSMREKVVRNLFRYVNSLSMNDIEARNVFSENPLNIKQFSSKIVKTISEDVIVFVHSKKYMIAYLPKQKSLRYSGIFDSMMFAQKIGLIKSLYDNNLENPSKFWKMDLYDVSYHILPIPLGYGVYETSYHSVYLVPTILVDVKRHIVGLGDVISASFASYLFCENKDVLF